MSVEAPVSKESLISLLLYMQLTNLHESEPEIFERLQRFSQSNANWAYQEKRDYYVLLRCLNLAIEESLRSPFARLM